MLLRTGSNNHVRHIVALIVVAAGILAVTGCAQSSSKPAELSPVSKTDDFHREVLQASQPALVDFSTMWCPACQQLKPKLEKLAGEYSRKARFFHVDLDKSPELKRQYDIVAYPTVILFSNGKEVNRWVNEHSMDVYKAAIDQAAVGQR